MEIKIYSTPTCGYCHQAKAFLDERGVRYTDYDVSRDQMAAQEMVKLTGQMGVPVIVVGGEVIIGFDRPRLEALLARGNGRGRPRLGLKVADASQRPRKPGEPPVFGALVGSVEPNSPGARAGILAGDIVTELDGTRVNNAGELGDIIAGVAAGRRVKITYYRGEQAVKAEIGL